MAVKQLLANFKTAFHDFERMLIMSLHKNPPEQFSFAEVPVIQKIHENHAPFDIFDNFMLWAVPKKRITIERRMTRKFGFMERFYKMHIPKTDLLICNHCGSDYERGFLCKTCFRTVMRETKLMRDKIKAALGFLKPIKDDVVVLYEGEKEQKSSEYWNGKRIVEMPKPRPAWFSKNLLQRSTAAPSDSAEIKPENLG